MIYQNSCFHFCYLLIQCPVVLSEVAGEGGPDLAPQNFLLSQQFRHPMRCKKYAQFLRYSCLFTNLYILMVYKQYVINCGFFSFCLLCSLQTLMHFCCTKNHKTTYHQKTSLTFIILQHYTYCQRPLLQCVDVGIYNLHICSPRNIG